MIRSSCTLALIKFVHDIHKCRQQVYALICTCTKFHSAHTHTCLHTIHTHKHTHTHTHTNTHTNTHTHKHIHKHTELQITIQEKEALSGEHEHLRQRTEALMTDYEQEKQVPACMGNLFGGMKLALGKPGVREHHPQACPDWV